MRLMAAKAACCGPQRGTNTKRLGGLVAASGLAGEAW